PSCRANPAQAFPCLRRPLPARLLAPAPPRHRARGAFERSEQRLCHGSRVPLWLSPLRQVLVAIPAMLRRNPFDHAWPRPCLGRSEGGVSDRWEHDWRCWRAAPLAGASLDRGSALRNLGIGTKSQVLCGVPHGGNSDGTLSRPFALGADAQAMAAL